jgi:GTP-binding protein HflX
MEVIITDTVGFIRHLPADLLKAFASTLEELFEADLLLHVIDAANPAWRRQVGVVEGVLAELGLEDIPCLKVFNKIDRLSQEERVQLALDREGVGICALDETTLAPLLVQAQRTLRGAMDSVDLERLERSSNGSGHGAQ